METQNIHIGIHLGVNYWSICFFNSRDWTTESINFLNNGCEKVIPSTLYPQKKSNGDLTFTFGMKKSDFLENEIIIENIIQFVGRKYSELPVEIIENSRCPIEEDENGSCVFVMREIGERVMRFTASELFKIQLNKLIDELRQKTKGEFASISVCVPEIIGNEQRMEIERVFELLGMKVNNFIEEPIAVMYQYKHVLNQNMGKTLIIDIEEKDTTISICTDGNEKIQLRQIERIESFGEDTFISILMEMILNQLEENEIEELNNFKLNEKLEAKFEKRLRIEAEKMFKSIQSHDHYEVDLETLLRKSNILNSDIIISRDEFEERIRETELLVSLENCIDRSMKKAQITRNQIDSIILLGSAMEMSIIKELVKMKFGENKIKFDRPLQEESSVIFSKGSLRKFIHQNPIIFPKI